MKLTRILFNYFSFSIYFLSGASVLSTIGWPTYGEGYFYPSPAFFLLIFTFIVCLLYSRHLNYYKFEFLGLVFLSLVLFFNYSTDRVFSFKAAVTALFTPFMFSIIIKNNGDQFDKTTIQKMFVAFLIVNSVVSILEQTTKTYMLSLTAELGGNVYGFRSHALLGHPLSNSGATTTLLCFILLSDLALMKKVVIWLLGFSSLLCFNSRLSIVMSFLMMIIWAFKEFTQKGEKGRFNIVYIVVPIVLLVFAYVMFLSGYGDRLLKMGLYDDSSAAARVEIWQIFNYIDYTQLYFGVTKNEQSLLLNLSGMQNLIIENCWIIFLLNYGYIFMTIMLCFFYYLFKKFLKGYNFWQACFVVLPWLVTISSSNSIAMGGLGITTMLLLLFSFNPHNQHRIIYISNKKVHV